MVPFIDIPPLSLGPLTIHPFGVMAVIAIWVGSWFGVRRGRERGLSEELVRAALIWLFIGGFVGAHVFEMIAYQPQELLRKPWMLLAIWSGLSSTGGFIGALIGLVLFVRFRGPRVVATGDQADPASAPVTGPSGQLLARLADAISLGLLPGWVLGRLGCTLAHDHPGVRSDFWLAVAYPGGARHDLGFYEMLLTIALFGLFELVRRRIRTPGHTALWIATAYLPVRFALDFLRIADRRYWLLTPAQIFCIGVLVACLAALVWSKKRSAEPQGPALPRLEPQASKHSAHPERPPGSEQPARPE